MAGQGVPIYASTFDASATEPVAVILAGSNSERINFRAGLSNIATSITDSMPLEVEIGMSQTVTVAKASLFSRSLGTSSPVGRFIYVWGPAANDSWSWLRAELTGISAANGTLTIVPRQAGEAGRSGNVITITNPPAAALEEAVAFFLDSGSVRRATAKDTTDQTNPTWSTASEIGRNVTSLELTYYDENNNVVAPDTLAARISIVSIGITLGTQTSERLGTAERAAFTLSTRTVLRNAKIR